jgi:glycosyltransferase involved in cell wall biosynthesis
MAAGSISIVLPDLRGGGAERVAVNLANCFVKRGFEVEMVLLAAHGAFLADLHPDIRLLDLKARRLRSALFPLARHLRQRRPDALLVFMWPLTVIALWSRWLSCIETRIVVAEHTTWSRDEIVRSVFSRWLVRTTMRYAFPSANAVVSVSRGAADDLASFAKLERADIHVVYNPVVGVTQNVSDELHTPEKWWSGSHLRILAVGALKPIKDYDTLLDAFVILRQQVNARLLILGEGNCRAKLEEKLIHLGLEGSVFMPGFVKDLAPYYKRADLHVLSSTGEGFGNVLVEALEAGTPVVSTDCQSGPREILLNGKYGSLVPVGDADALAKAMSIALSSTHDTESLKSRALDFSIEKAVNKYLDLLFPDGLFRRRNDR